MEESIVRKRLVEAAILAVVPRPSYAPGMFKITVEVIGVHIVYIFDAGPGHYSLDNITSWEAIERCRSNPLVTAMTDLLRAARDFKP